MMKEKRGGVYRSIRFENALEEKSSFELTLLLFGLPKSVFCKIRIKYRIVGLCMCEASSASQLVVSTPDIFPKRSNAFVFHSEFGGILGWTWSPTGKCSMALNCS